MPTLEETRTTILAEINAVWDAIAAAQAARFAAHGSYLQRLPTHSAIPADGVKAAPNQIATTPTDESEDGSEYFTFPAETYTCVSIDVSAGPEGQKFRCKFEFNWEETGMRQVYIIEGPERVDAGWNEYDPNSSPF